MDVTEVFVKGDLSCVICQSVRATITYFSPSVTVNIQNLILSFSSFF